MLKHAWFGAAVLVVPGCTAVAADDPAQALGSTMVDFVAMVVSDPAEALGSTMVAFVAMVLVMVQLVALCRSCFGRKQVASLRERLDVFTREAAEFKKDAEKLEIQVKSMSEQLKQQNAELSAAKKDDEQSSQSLRVDLGNRRTEVAALRKELGELRSRLSKVEGESVMLRLKPSEGTLNLAAQQSQIAVLEARVKTLEASRAAESVVAFEASADAALPAKVVKQIEKIETEAPGIEAAHRHAANGEVPAAEKQIMAEQYLDAIGGMRAAVKAAQRELDSTMATNKLQDCGGSTGDYEPETGPLKAKLAKVKGALAAGLADFKAKGFDDVVNQDAYAGLATMRAAELEKLPLCSTDTTHSSYSVSTTDSAGVAGVNLQRVLGIRCVLEAASADGAAATNEALQIYSRRVVKATPALARQILDDVAEYEAEMAERKAVPAEVEGLARLATKTAEPPTLTIADAEKMVAASSPDAPSDPKMPATALYARHQATAGSTFLYRQLCKLVAAIATVATVIPGSVKKLERFTFKVAEKYGGRFDLCRDLIRATIEVGSLADAATVAEALHENAAIWVVRTKDRFNQSSAEVLPIGGYRDYQLLCVVEVAPGVHRWAEIQVNLQAMTEIKGREGGGHDAFKFARSIGAYSPGSYEFKGGVDADLCDKIAAGVLLKVDVANDVAMSEDLALFEKFCEALKSTTCRLADLNLGYNELGEVGGTAAAKALETNTSLQKLDLPSNRLGKVGGTAVAKALKTNKSLQHLDLEDNELGEQTGIALGKALETNTSLQELRLVHNNLGEQTGIALGKALETNTSLQKLDLENNNLGASKTAIKTAWGNRKNNLDDVMQARDLSRHPPHYGQLDQPVSYFKGK